jgi:phosphatidylglycerophosphatase C
VTIVSASPELYIRPWAERIGVTEVIASRLAFAEGRFTGRLLGANCFGPEKARRIEAELGPSGAARIYAYGDSEGDREMLALATHGHLRKFHARRSGAGLIFFRAIL